MAGGKSNTHSQNWLKLVYQAVAWANMADNAATSPFTNIYVELSTGTLTATSAQNTTEAAYTSYARVAVARTTGGWGLSSQTISNVAAITFPAATANWGTITHVAIFDAATSGNMLMYSALDSSVIINSSDTFEFAAGALNIQLG